MISTLILARIYFATAITFHIVFPAINIGLSFIILLFEALYLKTNKMEYYNLCRFWTKVFAMLFGVGVVSGIMMSFMFGLTFARLIDFAGNILGPLLSFEVLTAFFLEASFLTVMLFGWDRVGKKYHIFSTFAVAIGTAISGFWILSANSFMQTPDGFAIQDGILVATDWMKVIFNPSFSHRFCHMINASLITASMVVFGSSVYFIKKKQNIDIAKISAKITAMILLICSVLQVYIGDSSGLNTLKHQPAKIAAMEAHWESHGDNGDPIILFAIPDQKSEKNKYEVAIPKLGSIILTHTMNGKIPALLDYDKEDRPPVSTTFFSFRIMVGAGVLLIIIGIWGVVASKRDKIGLGYTRSLNETEKNGKCHVILAPFHKLMTNVSILAIPLGIIATISGWYVTEVGRQPWVIYGIMRTKDAVTENLDIASLIFGISITTILYIAVAIVLIRYLAVTYKKGLLLHK